jgi:hypothetical protein
MRVLTAMVVAFVVAAMPMSVASGGSSRSGLEGKVSRGPITPVCIQARPCQAAASVTLAFSRGREQVARVRSTQAGDYRVALSPGVYTVTPAYPHPLWRMSPRSVQVPDGRYKRVNFLIDTGIR